MTDPDDGIVAGTEECDDANTDAGDGCADNIVEDGFSCIDEPSVCSTACGDMVVAGSEACDDGGNELNDGCDSTC